MIPTKQTKTGTSKLKDTDKKIVESEKTMIAKAMLFQKAFGNKELEAAIKEGNFDIVRQKVSQSGQELPEAKRLEEEEQILLDREALMPEIEEKMKSKKDKLNYLMRENPGIPIYVNVNIEKMYAIIRGANETTEEYYHYTDLKEVDFSLNDKNRDRESRSDSRVNAFPETFSFLFDENKYASLIIKEEEEETEEELEANAEEDEATAMASAEGAAEKDVLPEIGTKAAPPVE
ncbi:MAG: hypothetical protein GY754_38020 [bacterium]|nr:hypothetical protein [bacterium]